MKKFLLTLLTTFSLSFAMQTIRMPDEATLKLRLQGYAHFVEKTNILQELADEEVYPIGVAVALDRAYKDYLKQHPELSGAMRLAKPKIYEAFFREHPFALQELQRKGLIQ